MLLALGDLESNSGSCRYQLCVSLFLSFVRATMSILRSNVRFRFRFSLNHSPDGLL